MKDNLLEGLRPELVDWIVRHTHLPAKVLMLSSEERIALFRSEALELGITKEFTKQQVQDEMNACEVRAQILKEWAEAWRIELERYREELRSTYLVRAFPEENNELE